MDIEKLEQEGARALVMCYRSENKNHSEETIREATKLFIIPARAVIALTLKAAAEDWIAVAQSGFDAWANKPHNARWARKIDGTPIPNDLTICIGEAFANRLLSLAAQAEKTNG